MATLTVAPTPPVEELEAPLCEQPLPARVPTLAAMQPTRADRIAQFVVLILLLAAPAIMCVHSANVSDPDIWWHLRTGEWIQQHHLIPRVDPFSAPNAGKPWQAYSWLYEILVFGLFEKMGLAGVVAYSAGMLLAITVALWHLMKRLQADFSMVALLIFASCFSMCHLYTPRPWMFTILFFVLEVDILMHARRTGKTRELFWLPVIFALWSNIHIQFIDGLVVLGLAAAEPLLNWNGFGTRTSLRAKAIWTALAATVVGTLVNPFGWHIYRIAYDLASQKGVLNKISELQAIPFRDATDFTVLFLALGATAALARKKGVHIFELGLLLFAAVVSFRSQRDVWVMGVVAATIVASSLKARRDTVSLLPKFSTSLAAVAAAVLMIASFRALHVNEQNLQSKVDKSLPSVAVKDILAKGYKGPLYNDFTWGGYLIWSLRMPVALDGRAAFYGDQAIDRSVDTWGGAPDWNSDPQLKAARLVLGPVKSPLTQLLRTDSHFNLVYEDKVAAVFTRK